MAVLALLEVAACRRACRPHMPFDERLPELGLQRTLALRLFEKQQLTLAQAAKLAAVSTEDFMALAGAAGVAVVDYPPEELSEEMATARPRP